MHWASTSSFSCNHALELHRVREVISNGVIGNNELGNQFTLKITRHDSMKKEHSPLKLHIFIWRSREYHKGSHGASTQKGGHCHDPQHTSELAGLIPMAPDPMMSHERRRITTNAQSGNREWDVNTGVCTSMHQPI